jgi:hypothetical protein
MKLREFTDRTVDVFGALGMIERIDVGIMGAECDRRLASASGFHAQLPVMPAQPQAFRQRNDGARGCAHRGGHVGWKVLPLEINSTFDQYFIGSLNPRARRP